MKRYFVRAVKFAISLFLLLFVILMVIYLISKDVMSQDASLWRFFNNGRLFEMICIVVVFGTIYPSFGYTTVKIYMNKPLGENKNRVVEMFDERKYKFTGDQNKVMSFRPKSKLNRLMRMNEDILEIDYSDSILKFSGLRKDIYRFKLMLEEFARANV